MLLSLNWLKDFIDIPKNITPEVLGLKLTMHTVEIDGVEKQAERFNNVVVGKILKIKKHPQADKLQLIEASIGKATLNIVCGARNIKVGDFVPVALVGAVLPNGLEIRETEIRGEKSEGMLCAEDELGLGHDHSGIIILNQAKVGQDLTKHLKLDDIIFEIDNKSITNRPDLWGHFGLAREISAFLEVKLKEPKFDLAKLIKLEKNLEKLKLDVKIKDQKLCPRYMAVAVRGIEIGDSPKWLQTRLVAVGMRPINNIVDITNYVMLEFGQPLHAFDASLVKEIVVRRARAGEMIETLDWVKRGLTKDMLVIADSKKAIALAGIMGGAGSEISSKTNSTIIEAANFEPTQIRKTSQRLGLRTESSMRFEKSLDPNLCATVMARTIELIKQICPKAEAASDLFDLKSFKLNEEPIALDLNWLEKIIGEKIEDKKIIKILNNLGFETESEDKIIKVKVPTWRATKDVSIAEDLVEEIVRIYGYDNLRRQMPKVIMAAPAIRKEILLERKIKNILARGAKLTEVYNYSFVGENQLKKLRIEIKDYLKLANPIVDQQTLLRQSLVPNLLENVKINQSRHDAFGLFEIGSIFMDAVGEVNKDKRADSNLPYQEKRLGVAMAGDKNSDIFRRAKGVIEHLFSSFDLAVDFEPTEIFLAWADKKVTGKIISLGNVGKRLGFISRLDSRIAAALGIKKEVVLAEINFRELIELISSRSGKKYEKIPKYPSAVRDLAFVVDSKILYNNIKKEIKNFSSLVKEVQLFDIYEGEGLGKNKKNLAFHIIYQSLDRTLTAAEIEAEQKKLIKILEKKFFAQIRDF